MDRLRQLLETTYLAGLDTCALPKLREMKADCTEAEHALSYYRRLAQARIEILEAERARRERGGTVEELLAALPQILSAESGRSSITTTRVSMPDAPVIELHWPDGRERLVEDTTLANLGTLELDELISTLDALRDFERELSDLRRRLHDVIDEIEREIATRQVAGTAG